jgi:hypothetical protein
MAKDNLFCIKGTFVSAASIVSISSAFGFKPEGF